MPEVYPHEPMGAIPDAGHYELVVRSQAGAEQRLRELGALDEIERSVLAHCALESSGKKFASRGPDLA
jgi:hypothetical protein